MRLLPLYAVKKHYSLMLTTGAVKGGSPAVGCASWITSPTQHLHMDGINVLAKQQDILPVRAQKSISRGTQRRSNKTWRKCEGDFSPSFNQTESVSLHNMKGCVYCRHREIRHIMQTRASKICITQLLCTTDRSWPYHIETLFGGNICQLQWSHNVLTH